MYPKTPQQEPENREIVERKIYLDIPHCTLQEYARRTGISEKGAANMAQSGRLPMISIKDPKKPNQRNTRVMVNLMKLAEDALLREW